MSELDLQIIQRADSGENEGAEKGGTVESETKTSGLEETLILETLSALEEGEIEDDNDLDLGSVDLNSNPNPVIINPHPDPGNLNSNPDPVNLNPNPVCRFYSRGYCVHGENCRFIHIGFNSDFSIINNQILPNFGPQPVCLVNIESSSEDSWDKGLKEAKQRVLNAKIKKEADLNFEEKKLYMDMERCAIRKDNAVRSQNNEKHKLRAKAPEDTSGIKLMYDGKMKEKISKKYKQSQELKSICRKRSECRSNSESKTQSKIKLRLGALKSRQQNVSKSSSSRQRHRRDSPSFSTYSGYSSFCRSRKSRDYFLKTKLERALSKSVAESGRSRSRKLTSSRPSSTQHRGRSLSRHSFIKRFINRSYSKSRSPLPNKHSMKQDARKRLQKKAMSPTPEKRKRFSNQSKTKLNRLSSQVFVEKSYRSRWDSSSEMTISSLECTSLSESHIFSSDVSYSVKEFEPSKSREVKENSSRNINLECEREASYSCDIQKWLDAVPKPKKIDNGNFESSGKKTEVVEKVKKRSASLKTDQALSKPSRKPSTYSETSSERFSAAELELFKYIPRISKKFKQKKASSKKVDKNQIGAVSHSPKKLSEIEQIDCAASLKASSHKSDAKSPSPKSSEKSISQKSSEKNISQKSSEKSISQKSSEKSISQKSSEKNISQKSDEKSISQKSDVKSMSQKSDEALTKSISPKKSDEISTEKHSSSKSDDASIISLSPVKPNTAEANNAPSTSCQLNRDTRRSCSNKSTSSQSSCYQRPLSSAELELLKYATMKNPDLSKEIRKKTVKNPSSPKRKISALETDKIITCKKAKRSYDEPKRSDKVRMSRREFLTRQLKAVELAIAKKKQQTVLQMTAILKRKSYRHL